MKQAFLFALFAFLAACGSEKTADAPASKPGNDTAAQKSPMAEAYEQYQKTADQNKATTRKFFELVEKEDIKGMAELFAKDGIHVNPYHSGMFPDSAIGRQAVYEYWAPVPDKFDGLEFSTQEIYAMEDPKVVYIKYRGKIKLKDDTGYYRNQYYSTVKFNEAGQITEFVEIFNPVLSAKSFGLKDQLLDYMKK